MTSPQPSPATLRSEREWIAGIRAGDERAFAAMFKAYYDLLCRYIAVYLGNRDAAEDVVQGVFTRIWDDRESWDVRGPLRHYLVAAARCGAINHLRHDAVRQRTAPFLALEAARRGGGAPADAEFEAEELRRHFELALNALPPRSREAFTLSRDEGLSYDQVALRMGISLKTVGVHIGKALAALRKAMLIVAGIAAAAGLSRLS